MMTSSDLDASLEELCRKLRASLKIDHLLTLTDHIALLQHAKFSVPARKEGYAVDDSARALVFSARAGKLCPDQRLSKLTRKLSSFLLLMQEEDGRFHNLMDSSQRIIDEPTVGDHLGRAIWAAGRVINSDLPTGMRAAARLIFDRALPWVRSSTFPRTHAYACLGLHERLKTETDSNLKANLREIADTLVALYKNNRAPDWNWFENILSYDNARLSQALLVAYQTLQDQVYLEIAKESLRFLEKITVINETYVPIGSKGWYMKGGERALYDQQPIEAGAMVETATLAYRLTGSKSDERTMRQALGWFFGLNTNSVRLYDDSTGACYDGINEKGLNENQGAESTLAFLLATQAVVENLSNE